MSWTCVVVAKAIDQFIDDPRKKSVVIVSEGNDALIGKC